MTPKDILLIALLFVLAVLPAFMAVLFVLASKKTTTLPATKPKGPTKPPAPPRAAARPQVVSKKPPASDSAEIAKLHQNLLVKCLWNEPLVNRLVTSEASVSWCK
jgi:hypothetical protein